jgi:rhamnosyltransferase subunit B
MAGRQLAHHAFVLSNIGTFGDINPLIAIALELKRRGHVPVMALPNVYRPKIEPLGLEFHALRPDIDPTNTLLVEMIYDVKKGTETGLREFLFPVLRQTYDDLLDAATKPARADLLLLGELNYAGPIVAEVTGIPWASYVLAPFSFFSAFDPPVLPPYPQAGAGRQDPGMGRAMRRLARFVTRKWPEPIYELRANWDCRRARTRSSTPSTRRTWCWRCFRACWAPSRRIGRRTR